MNRPTIILSSTTFPKRDTHHLILMQLGEYALRCFLLLCHIHLKLPVVV